MKYPLTDTAKEAAKALVAGWDAGTIEQQFVVIISRYASGFDVFLHEGGQRDFKLPPLPSLLELAHFGLITVQRVLTGHSSENWEILLLQELRNAVESDFDVSEYFLTMNAVGTVVQGNLTLHAGSVFQSAATNTGAIQQSNEQLADTLTMQLGRDFLQTQKQLREAIDQLREAAEGEKPSRLGSVLLELGRCLSHGANAAQVIPAITAVSSALAQLIS